MLFLLLYILNVSNDKKKRKVVNMINLKDIVNWIKPCDVYISSRHDVMVCDICARHDSQWVSRLYTA